MKTFTLFFMLISIIGVSQEYQHECPDNTSIKIDTFPDYTIYQCIKKNMQHGLSVGFYNNGTKYLENYWNDGKPEGIWREWGRNGHIYSAIVYDNGQKNGAETFYFVNGKTKVITNYRNGIKHGRIDQWDENGVHLIEGNFKDGLKDGLWFIRKDSKTIVANQFSQGNLLFEKEMPFEENELPKVEY